MTYFVPSPDRAARPRWAYLQGALELAADLQQREQLIDHVVRGHQSVGIGIEPGTGRRMVRIGGNEICKPRARVHEDHEAAPARNLEFFGCFQSERLFQSVLTKA